jgi:uncharacterized protein with ParB-like and HNH nuclease domain
MSKSMDISATEDTLDSVLSRNYRFQVPDYQRRYSWEKKQWGEFWSDLMSLVEDNRATHFIGSIVVIKKPGKLDELDLLELVDGQQRLTTVSLILCLLRERYKREDNMAELVEVIDDDYLWVRDSDLERYQNITLSSADNDNYRSLLNGNWNRDDENQLNMACEFFAGHIRELEIATVDELRKRLLNSMTIVTIECNNELSAFRLFETLNPRGLELSAVDLMKNHLLQIANESQDIGTERVKEQWEIILENILPVLSKPEKFFRHYIMSSPAPDLNVAISNYKLYENFRNILGTELEDANLTVEEYISDMAEKSSLYVDIVNRDVDLYRPRAQKAINSKLRDLDAINNVQARTFILRLFQEFSNPNKVVRALEMLEVFSFRRSIADSPTGGALDRIYSRICSQVFNTPEPLSSLKVFFSDRMPGDDVFKSSLADLSLKSGSRTKYMLDIIEREHFMSSGYGKGIDRSAVDIEHIAPRSAFDATKYSTWRGYLGVDKDTFYRHRDSLGNLTLLESIYNARASDKPFEQKKDEYRTSDFEMTRSICEYDEWSIDLIG